jgi:hypothetical protein
MRIKYQYIWKEALLIKRRGSLWHVRYLTNVFCSRCGHALDEKARLQVIKDESNRKEADSIIYELL